MYSKTTAVSGQGKAQWVFARLSQFVTEHGDSHLSALCPWAEWSQFFSARPGFTQRDVTTPGEQDSVELLVASPVLVLLSQGLASWQVELVF